MPNCELCGELMPTGEEMFKFHGYSGLCPRPPIKLEDPVERVATEAWAYIEHLLTEECGLPPDEGLEQERANCVNAIKNAITAVGQSVGKENI